MSTKSTDVNTHIKGRWKLIVAIIVLVTAFYAFPISAIVKPPRANPRGHPLHMQTVRIDVIVPGPDWLERIEPVFELATNSINNFCDKLEYNVDFEFLLEHADLNTATHLEKVEMFDDMGVNLIIGGFWSGQAQGSPEYVKENDMLMFSPSSTAPGLAEEDNLFRLCPDDASEIRVTAKTLWSWGIEHVIILRQNGFWFEELADRFGDEFPLPVYGSVTYQVLYPEESPPEYPDILERLDDADDLVDDAFDDCGDYDRIAILYLGFDEVTMIAESVFHEMLPGPIVRYPNLQIIRWFSNSWTALYQPLLGANADVDGLKFFSTLITPSPRTGAWNWFVTRYRHGEDFGIYFYDALCYDIA